MNAEHFLAAFQTATVAQLGQYIAQINLRLVETNAEVAFEEWDIKRLAVITDQDLEPGHIVRTVARPMP